MGEELALLALAVVFVPLFYVLVVRWVDCVQAKKMEVDYAKRRRQAEEVIHRHYGNLPSDLILSIDLESPFVPFSRRDLIDKGAAGLFAMDREGNLVADYEHDFPPII